MVLELSMFGVAVDPTTTVEVECLRCGTCRAAGIWDDGRLDAGACPCCSDVGWARPTDLTDEERLAVRSLPAPT